jgi:hypothetical protein
MDPNLAQVLRAWELSAPLHDPNPGCSADDLAEAARRLGRRLPAAFKQLYAAAGGGSFLHGNRRARICCASRSGRFRTGS